MNKRKDYIIIFLFIICTMLLIKIFTTNKYDVNNDGKVNSKDLLEIRVYLINKGE